MKLDDLLPIGLVIVVLVIVLAYGADVTDEVRGDFITNTAGCNSTVTTNCGTNYNVTQDGLESMEKLSSKIPTIVTVVVAAVIIGILVTYFAFRR